MDERRVLLVGEDVATRQLIGSCLRNAGYLVDSAESRESALAWLRRERYALLVVDISLAGLEGVALLTSARQHDPQLEIIVVTGDGSLDCLIAAFNNGAARYLRKPVPASELEQSVAAALARRRERIDQAYLLRQIGSQLLRLAEGQSPYGRGAQPDDAVVRVGELVLDTQRYQASAYGRPVQLSNIQFNLLLYLARRSERVINPCELVKAVLGYECSPAEAGELLKRHVHNLRQKIERDPAAPQLLLSRRGVGYLLTAGRPAG